MLSIIEELHQEKIKDNKRNEEMHSIKKVTSGILVLDEFI